MLISKVPASAATSASEKLTVQPFTPREEIIRQFNALDIYFTGGRYQREKFSYRLYTPPQIDKDTKYPLLVWFHGAGESGNDNRRHLAHLDGTLLLFKRKAGAFPGFVLVPQAPKDIGWFATGLPKEGDMVTIAWDMLQRTVKECPIDENRIVLAGVSSGGNACWEMGMRHPGRFAAIASIASAGGDESRASNLVGAPIWAFNNLYDKQAPIEGARRMVQAVRASGGRAKLTEIADIGHAAWNQALHTNCKLLEWLLERRRGESNWNCYFQFVDWPTIAVQCGLPTAAIAISLIWFGRREFLVARHAHNLPKVSDSKGELPNLASLIGEKL